MLASFMAAMLSFSLRSLLVQKRYSETTRYKLAVAFSVLGMVFLSGALVGSLRVIYSRFFAAVTYEAVWHRWSGVVSGGIMLWLASWIIAGWLNKDAEEWSD